MVLKKREFSPESGNVDTYGISLFQLFAQILLTCSCKVVAVIAVCVSHFGRVFRMDLVRGYRDLSVYSVLKHINTTRMHTIN